MTYFPRGIQKQPRRFIRILAGIVDINTIIEDFKCSNTRRFSATFPDYLV